MKDACETPWKEEKKISSRDAIREYYYRFRAFFRAPDAVDPVAISEERMSAPASPSSRETAQEAILRAATPEPRIMSVASPLAAAARVKPTAPAHVATMEAGIQCDLRDGTSEWADVSTQTDRVTPSSHSVNDNQSKANTFRVFFASNNILF